MRRDHKMIGTLAKSRPMCARGEDKDVGIEQRTGTWGSPSPTLSVNLQRNTVVEHVVSARVNSMPANRSWTLALSWPSELGHRRRGCRTHHVVFPAVRSQSPAAAQGGPLPSREARLRGSVCVGHMGGVVIFWGSVGECGLVCHTSAFGGVAFAWLAIKCDTVSQQAPSVSHLKSVVLTPLDISLWVKVLVDEILGCADSEAPTQTGQATNSKRKIILAQYIDISTHRDQWHLCTEINDQAVKINGNVKRHHIRRAKDTKATQLSTFRRPKRKLKWIQGNCPTWKNNAT
ncbi:hypothetical protein GGX14DRAFT_630202 [Mycena pura]|uniref:Uncharacterized protein n=1 Tax=Mycena pura TaxID=153505 RepID=A0AAD6VDD1_9AGAR|nr:hypothetical protein GGX14DRAFT_630202 [Mycena pura]